MPGKGQEGEGASSKSPLRSGIQPASVTGILHLQDRVSPLGAEHFIGQMQNDTRNDRPSALPVREPVLCVI